MNAIIPFDFEGEPVRVVLLDGEPHFVAADVTARLGYSNSGTAIARHCRGVPKRETLQTAGGVQELRVISEPDVIRLVMGSKLAGAQHFEAWVFETVLPSIRRDGTFGQSAPLDLGDARALRHVLLTYSEKVIALEEENAILAPKAAALDRLAAADGSQTITLAAKELGIAPNKLFDKLEDWRWIYRDRGRGRWVAYQTALDTGRMEHRPMTFTTRDGREHLGHQALVTAKGVARIAELLAADTPIALPPARPSASACSSASH